MPTVQTVLDAIDRIAPSEWAFSFDKVGLQVGESTDTVERAAVALDPSTELIAFARHASIQLVVC
ncbi:MAG TPA: Nif3-like dinuclear metal center hexameric protein, partial [Fimbriimonadaceae bacterium]|nr:Nif3-like dinuclear metal center hexameric protein [Fimbriimonadaceae bacterium]